MTSQLQLLARELNRKGYICNERDSGGVIELATRVMAKHCPDNTFRFPNKEQAVTRVVDNVLADWPFRER